MSRVRCGQRCVLVLAGDGVQVHDADEGLVAVLELDPVLHRAEPVADVQLAGRLDPGEYAWHGGQHTRFRSGHTRWCPPWTYCTWPGPRRSGPRPICARWSGPADPAGWTVKGSRDFVTEVDRTAEQIIAEVLLAAEPGSRIVGEELSPELVTDGLVWVVDPLDGTTNFLHGFPSYAVSIAAAVDGSLQAGVVLHVPRDEVYCASRGGGAWHGERRLARLDHRRSGVRPDRHRLSLQGHRPAARSTSSQFARVAARPAASAAPGSAALDLADVAAGRFDGFWEQRLSAWDIAAGMLLVREAGGVRHRLRRPRHRGRAHGARGGKSGDSRWLLEVLAPAAIDHEGTDGRRRPQCGSEASHPE